MAGELLRRGWSVDLGNRGLGDVLLGLAMVRALTEASDENELHYEGPRASLMRRSVLPLTADQRGGTHLVRTGGERSVRFDAIPELPPVWLDLQGEDLVEVHAALPMRYYLEVEQAVGRRLPADRAPAPLFVSTVLAPRGFHVVFVATTSLPGRKDYGTRGFACVARALAARLTAPWTFTVIMPPGSTTDLAPFGDLPVHAEVGMDVVDCLDVFASAELVVGNDTGLTHLAALAVRPDGTGPEVIGLYGRHSYAKWSTGSDRHHAAATVFSQMLAAADGCPVRDQLDDALWDTNAALGAIPPDDIARFGGERAGWW